jgi:hypothetical protein
MEELPIYYVTKFCCTNNIKKWNKEAQTMENLRIIGHYVSENRMDLKIFVETNTITYLSHNRYQKNKIGQLLKENGFIAEKNKGIYEHFNKDGSLRQNIFVVEKKGKENLIKMPEEIKQLCLDCLTIKKIQRKTSKKKKKKRKKKDKKKLDTTKQIDDFDLVNDDINLEIKDNMDIEMDITSEKIDILPTKRKRPIEDEQINKIKKIKVLCDSLDFEGKKNISDYIITSCFNEDFEETKRIYLVEDYNIKKFIKKLNT